MTYKISRKKTKDMMQTRLRLYLLSATFPQLGSSFSISIVDNQSSKSEDWRCHFPTSPRCTAPLRRPSSGATT